MCERESRRSAGTIYERAERPSVNSPEGTNALRPKIRIFFLPWEIGCVAWVCVKTCRSVCHTVKPWELAALWVCYLSAVQWISLHIVCVLVTAEFGLGRRLTENFLFLFPQAPVSMLYSLAWNMEKCSVCRKSFTLKSILTPTPLLSPSPPCNVLLSWDVHTLLQRWRWFHPTGPPSSSLTLSSS